MNWDAIGAVGEVAGAIAVVITLIYLSIQLRINTGALKNAASAQQASTFIELTRNAYENPVVTELILKLQSIDSAASLSNEEALKANFFFLSHLKAGEHNHLQHLGGYLSDEEWQTIEAQAPAFVNIFPVFKEFWEAGLREQVAPSYATFWDDILREHEESGTSVNTLPGLESRSQEVDTPLERPFVAECSRAHRPLHWPLNAGTGHAGVAPEKGNFDPHLPFAQIRVAE